MREKIKAAWSALVAKRTRAGWCLFILAVLFWVSDKWDSLNSLIEKLKNVGPVFKFMIDAAQSPFVQLCVFILGVLWIGIAVVISARRMTGSNFAAVTFAKEIPSRAGQSSPQGSTLPVEQSSALKSEEPLLKKDIPAIYCKLQIDAVKDGWGKFHIQVKNGPTLVENVEMHIWSQKYTHYEPGSLARDIAPNDVLFIPLSQIPVGLGKDDELTITLYYDANVFNIDRHLIASYRFPLPSRDELDPYVITPAITHYREGDRLSNRGRDPSEEQLGRNEGTIVFSFVEENDGKIDGIWSMRNGDRFVTADNVNRIVSFTTPIENGNAIRFGAPFKDTYDGFHVCRVSWNPSGGTLVVDSGEKYKYP